MLFAWIAGTIFLPTAAAHPFHLCVGQMKWNAQSDRWEVSLRLHPQDLELSMNLEAARMNPALDRKYGVEDKDFPENATLYINQHLFLRRSAAATTLAELTAILESEARSESKIASDDKTGSERFRSEIKWVGMEQEKGWLWIHLEMQSVAWNSEEEKLWMINELLLDHVPRQENTMAVDPVTQPKFSLQFKKDQRIRELDRTR